jgi:hypothetical protein
MTHRRRLVRWLLWSLAGLMCLFLGLLATDALRLRRDVRILQSHVQTVLAAGDDPTVAAALEAVRALRGAVGALERDWGRLRGHGGWLLDGLSRQGLRPWLADWATVGDQGLAAGSDLLATAWWCLLRLESDLESDGLVNTASGVPVTLEANPGRTVGLALQDSRARLLAAREAALRLSAALDRLDAGTAEPPAWRSTARLLPQALDALLLAADVLSTDEERTYALLLQNADELRASGGFISSLALFTVRAGRLQSTRYLNSYDVEAYRAAHPAPPAPIARYMGASVLLFRDANWSPDFPTTANVLAALLQLDLGVQVGGVVALDSTLAQLALQAIGPLDIPDYGVSVTAENVVEMAVAFWERPLEGAAITQRGEAWDAWLDHRKDFGGALLSASVQRLRRLTPAEALRLLAALREGIRGRHLLAWALTDPRLQEDLRRAGLDGALLPATGDYLMVVDTNMGWNKADRVVERSIRYMLRETVDAQGHPALQAHLCLTYRNTAEVTMPDCVHQSVYYDTYRELAEQCYWDYVRVLAPRGARLVTVEGAESPVDDASEGGKAGWGALLVVPPGEERSLCLTYDLPAGALAVEGDGVRYTLTIQKQPGTRATPLEVSVELAPDSALDAPLSPWTADAPQLARATSTLATDQRLALSWRVQQ